MTVPAASVEPMTTAPHFDFHLNRPGRLIAALPAVLGFVPEQSLVVVTLDGGEMGCVMRVDLSDDLRHNIDHLAEVAAAAGPDAAVAVVVDANGAGCHTCGDDHREVVDALTVALAEHGVELLAAHVVDRIAAGGHWHCVDGCGSGGPVEDPTSSPLAAAAVLEGRRLYSARAELTAVIAPDPARAAELAVCIERAAGERGSDRSDADAAADVEDALKTVAGIRAGDEPADRELARLACALVDLRVRDTLYALAVGEDAVAAESLWALLSRVLPAPWRVEALVLLAFSAYARGDGPLAGISLEAALRCGSGHRMAAMLDTALRSAMRPEQIRELAVTGYRLADRLGVRLPARKAFGRLAS